MSKQKEIDVKYTHKIEVETEVTHLIAEIGVRYWEDATVNGEPEDGENPKMPLRDGEVWKLKVDLATGKIEGWPEGNTATTYYKVCDDGRYGLIGNDGETVVEYDGYVPDMLAPLENGFGDYVILNICADGSIDGWKADLSDFYRRA